MALVDEQMLGLTDSHISDELEVPVHHRLVVPLLELKQEAKRAGFDLRLASGFRCFERQRQIWNAKARGDRPVLDANEKPLDISFLTPLEQVRAIMRWSALPGTSRHHWGTDVDVFDAAALGPGESVQLTLLETREGGPFARFHRWLDQSLSEKGNGFYRPYCSGLDEPGVAPEPWHLSYAPLSATYVEKLTIDRIANQLGVSDIALKPVVLENLDSLFDEFVCLG